MDGIVRFLVVEPHTLVQMDLAQSLEELVPHAQVARLQSLSAAEHEVEQWDRLEGAVIGVGVDALRDTMLPELIRQRGGWIICLDADRAAAEREGWSALGRPVFSDDLVVVVRGLMSSRSRTAAAF
ncbi:hypothetical protein [Roseitranquillus sediminis]|uniref:hypothetical protein n=1 Tax=Roseitranquillus sediminis TaxID=2809051 RepID=UPI001D0C8A00|nr:hypothetical protein [Roseitranquillus sediminis]MBM9596375.1 hypothetical protein [Roseitranquillus sediminis]